jgi:hypothetical protein
MNDENEYYTQEELEAELSEPFDHLSDDMQNIHSRWYWMQRYAAGVVLVLIFLAFAAAVVYLLSQ